MEKRNENFFALAVLLMVVPAYAQGGKSGGKRRNATSDPQAEGLKKKRTDASEKAYKSALDKIPNKPFDPWGNMREAPRPK